MKYLIKRIDPETNEESIRYIDKLTTYSKEINIPIHIVRKNLYINDQEIKNYKSCDSYKSFYDTIKIYTNKRKF